MFTMFTVLRKRPEVSSERFRAFMEHEYGTIYAAMPQVLLYEQYYLNDVMQDGAEQPVDAIVRISFDSQDAMKHALDSDAYRTAHRLREAYMQPTSIGIHSAVLDATIKLV